MFRKILMSVTGLFLIFSLLSFKALAQESDSIIIIQHDPIQKFKYGDVLTISARITGKPESVKLFYRPKSLSQFQARDMEKRDDSFIYTLDTASLPDPEFDYYLEANIGPDTFRFPPDAPNETIQVVGEQTEVTPEIPQQFPPPEEEEKKFKFPISANLSLDSRLAEKEPSTGQKTTLGGNIKVFQNLTLGKHSRLDIDSNFNYTSVPPSGEKKIDLSNLNISFSSKSHTFNVGDISLTESEFSISGLGRRGIEYLFDNRKIYIHLFDVNSQQPKGFKGFGIPRSYLSLLGAALGFNLFQEAIFLKGVVVTGKDDPSKGVNTESSLYYQSRKGTVAAIVEETRLFNNTINLKGEYARSSYDRDLTDELPRQKDKAYNLSGQFRYKVFNLSSGYNYIGKNFNSIGYPFMTNDRKNLFVSANLSLGKVDIAGSLSSQSDNVKEEPNVPTTKNLNGNANLGLKLSQRVTINLGYRRDNQSTYQNNMEIAGQDSLTSELSGNLTWSASDSTSFNLSLTNSRLSSQSSPESDSSAFNLNLGALIRAGSRLSLGPTAGYSLSKNIHSGETSKIFNIGANGDLTIWPRYLSLNLSGYYNYTQMALGNSHLFNVASSLNFSLADLLKKLNIILSLRGNYSHQKDPSTSKDNYALFLQGSLSF